MKTIDVLNFFDSILVEGEHSQMYVLFEILDYGDLVFIEVELTQVRVPAHVFNLLDLIVRQVYPLKCC